MTDTYTLSSGNVFADLDVAQPDDALAKARLASKLSEFIRARGLSQSAAAKLLGIDQPKVSAILRGRLTAFSTERLMRFLTLLGSDVEIVVSSPRRRSRPGRLAVHFA